MPGVHLAPPSPLTPDSNICPSTQPFHVGPNEHRRRRPSKSLHPISAFFQALGQTPAVLLGPPRPHTPQPPTEQVLREHGRIPLPLSPGKRGGRGAFPGHNLSLHYPVLQMKKLRPTEGNGFPTVTQRNHRVSWSPSQRPRLPLSWVFP